jgi:hypothetical protein
VAYGISADGNVIVGDRYLNIAFRWTQSGGLVDIGHGLAGYTGNRAESASADGSVVVGRLFLHGTGNGSFEAGRWTEATGWTPLGFLDGGPRASWATSVSGDGSIVVGQSGGVGPFIWDTANGMRNLVDVFRDDYGLGDALAGRQLGIPENISEDGRTIVGGNWIAFLGTPVAQPIPTWNLDADGNWSSAGNWTIGVPNAATQRATFGGAISAPRTVNVDVPITVRRIDFDSANGYTLAGTNALTLDVGGGNAQIHVTKGSHVITAPLNLAHHAIINIDPASAQLSIGGARYASGVRITKGGAGNLQVNNVRAASLLVREGSVTIAPNGTAESTSVVRTLEIEGGAMPSGRLDVTNNSAIVDYSTTSRSPELDIRSLLISGRGGAGLGKPWNGNGITSSAAATANATEPESRSVGYAYNGELPLGSYTTFHGQPVDDSSILIAYTRTGDANLDGVVNDDDVTILGAKYAPGVSQLRWAWGDFDYNGFVDDDDVTLLGAFYDPSAAPLIAAAPATSVAPVPEPGTSMLCMSGLIAVASFSLRRWFLSRSERAT